MANTFNPDNITMQDARTGAIPTSKSDEILTDVKRGSAFMQLAKAVPMTKPIEKFTKLSGVGAYWVDEAARIKTDKPTWLTVEMRAHKLGVIIPTSKENLAYSVSNFFALMRAEIAEAFYKKFDIAAFGGGGDSPYNFSILKSATAAGAIVDETNNKYTDINNAMAKVEAHDLVPNGIASTNKQRTKYRSTKDTTGLPIFNAPTASEPGTVLGLPVAYMHNGAFGDVTIAEIVGDWNNALYGILQGIQYEVSTDATLTTMTSEGAAVSAFERDLVFLKATMMVGMMVFKDAAFSVVKTKAA